MTDAMLSWLLLKPGGLLVFDDYAWQPQKPPHQRPQLAIDAFLNVVQPQVLHKGYQVVVRKPGQT
jgi:predicted O-methyltransferase YrrM